MPTVEGARARCPECGATSRTASDVMKCEYCDTESRVQKRTAVVQLAISLNGISVGKNALFVLIEEAIQGFDPKTGTRRFVVGKAN